MMTMQLDIAQLPRSDGARVQRWGLSWPLLVAMFAALVFGAGVPGSRLLSDGDTLWHLAAGRWILENGTVPTVDVFSHSMPGAPWTAHEWLAEVTMAVIFELASWSGLVVMSAVAYAVALSRLTRFLLHRLEPLHALALVALALGLSAGHLLARPHVIAWMFLVAWVAELVEAIENKRLPPWWSLGLVAVWANLHGSFILGVALAFALAVEAAVGSPPGTRLAVTRRWGVFLAAAMLVSMLTPRGWEGWSHAAELMQMQFALTVIGEWRSPNFQTYQPLELWLLVFLALALSGRLRLPWLRMALVLALLHMALKHQRHIAVFGLVTPILLARPFAESWYRRGETRGGDAVALDRFFAALALPAQWRAAVACGALCCLALWAVARGRDVAPNPDVMPAKAVQAARAAGAAGPVLNRYSFGGYLIFSGIPVFIDGRADMYGDALVKRTVDALALRDPEGLQALVDEYRIGWTLLEPESPSVALLDALPGWRRIYSDKVAVVHVRVAQ